MNLKGIKTEDQFNTFANNWYWRTLNLAAVMNNKNNSDLKRLRAFALHQRMYKRMMLIVLPISKRLHIKGDINALKLSKLKGGLDYK